MGKRKKLILGILAIPLFLIVFNLHKIKFTIDLINLYRIEKNHNIVSKPNIIKDELVNPLENIDEKYVDNNPPLHDSSNTDNNDNKPIKIKSSSKKNNKVEDEPRSYISIVSEYNDLLLKMKSSFEDDLDKLVKDAIKEYSKDSISTSKLASKYLSLGSSLEKDCDLKVKSLINNMKKELEANGHPTSIIKETEDYYTSFKNTKKSEVLDKGMKYLD